jgi:hypothetical protein
MNTSATPSWDPRLTFGVEIELLLATLEPEDRDPHPNDPRQVRGITDPLTDKNAWGVHEYRRAETSRNTIAGTLVKAGISAYRATKLQPSGPRWARLEDWQLVDDSSITEPPEDNPPYVFFRVEIVSPPLYFSEEACQQVRAVIEVLTNNYRIVTPKSAGVHVHVGNESIGFTGPDLRKILATLWTFEPTIDTIHPPWRKGNIWADSLRGHSVFGIKVMETNATLKQTPEMVFMDGSNLTEAQLWLTIMALADTTGERGAYNFRNLRAQPHNIKKTIEFRQHESTLDPDRVYNWIKVCVGLIGFAHRIDVVALKEFLLLHIDDSPEEFTLVNVLKSIGLPPQSLYYSTKRPYLPVSGSTTATSS